MSDTVLDPEDAKPAENHSLCLMEAAIWLGCGELSNYHINQCKIVAVIGAIERFTLPARVHKRGVCLYHGGQGSFLPRRYFSEPGMVLKSSGGGREGKE